MGRPINQRVTEDTELAVGEGRLMTRGPRRGTRRIVSASATPHDLTGLAARLKPNDSRRTNVEALRDALTALTAAQYGRAQARSESTLDDALEGASRAASSVRAQYQFPGPCCGSGALAGLRWRVRRR